jgi:nicotinamide-nucleotide amidase
MRAAVIAMGDELATGERLDTNSQWLARELSALGAEVCLHVTCPDDLGDAVAAFRAATGSDVVVATGGLGPTADDLTREILAGLAGRRLVLREEAMDAIHRRFSLRGMEMPESNRLQAMFPEGSRMIPNPEGTAPGIDIDLEGIGGRPSRLFALPGVPSEMRRMWADTVGPAILAMQPDRRTIRFRVLRCFGAGESAIEAMLPDLIRRGRDPLVGITAHEATITLRIAARGRDEAECLARIAPVEETIRRCLGPLVFGGGDDEIEDATLAAVAGMGGTLATVEAATCGLVASLASAAEARRGRGRPSGGAGHAALGEPGSAGIGSGAGQVFLAGTVLAGVGRLIAADLEEEAVACRMRSGATLALAIGEESVNADGSGMVPMVLLGPCGVTGGAARGDVSVLHVEHRLAGSGSLRIARAAKAALDLVRKSCLAVSAGDVPVSGPPS